MSDSSQRRGKRSTPDIDISTDKSGPSLGFRGNVVVWVGFVALIMLFYYVEMPYEVIIAIVPVALVAFIAWMAFRFIVKRGIFTWMRLAQTPARLLAQGKETEAEETCVKALARARQFPPDDHRRGMMFCELAMFVKHQGRMAESLALYEESVNILAAHAAKEPMDYFVVLNNYGICFIHLKDYAEAQKILERAIDLTMAARKREADRLVIMPLAQVQLLQFVLHMNLAFLFMEMHELGEAELQLRAADALVTVLPKRALVNWHDHYVAMCALWEYQSGNFKNAEEDLAEATNPDFPSCLRMRAKLLLVRQEFVQAEEALRKYQAAERKRGILLRPDMLNQTLEFAEALFGQGKHEEAFGAVEDARKIVADFALPFDRDWQRAVESWLKRSRELGRSDVAAWLEIELQRKPPVIEQGVTILDKLRIKPEASQ